MWESAPLGHMPTPPALGGVICPCPMPAPPALGGHMPMSPALGATCLCPLPWGLLHGDKRGDQRWAGQERPGRPLLLPTSRPTPHRWLLSFFMGPTV